MIIRALRYVRRTYKILNMLLIDWLEQVFENKNNKNNYNFIEFNDLDISKRNRKQKNIPLKSNPGLEITKHALSDFYDEDINEKEMDIIMSSKEVCHENLLKAFICHCTNDEEYYLLVEYVNQGDLTIYLKNTGLTWDRKLDLATQLASGLAFLHKQNIVHYNLNPKNIFINRSNSGDNLKLTNIGVINVFKSEDFFEIIPYIEPQALKSFTEKADDPKEHTHKPNITRKSNIYSMGVLLWHIASGKRPYDTIPRVDMVKQIIEGRREEALPSTPTKYLDLYRDCWDPDQDKRPKNCSEIWEILKTVNIHEIIDNKTININDLYDITDKSDFYQKQKLSNFVDGNYLTIQEPDKKTFLLQSWSLCKGLKTNSFRDILFPGDQILTMDGEIGYIKKEPTEILRIYTNKTPASPLKIGSVSFNQDTEEIGIRLHITLLEVEYRNPKISDEFTKVINEALNKPDQESIHSSLQEIFKRYGEYIAQNVDIGGALTVKLASDEDDETLSKEIEILKAHIYWAYDQIISGKPNVFDQVQFNNFIMEDAQKSNTEKIDTGHKLMSWMKNFYEDKNGYVISYNRIIPVYSLFEDEIKQSIHKALGIRKLNKKPMKLIPHMLEFKVRDLNTWISRSQLIHLCSWVNDLYLHHGLIIHPCKIERGLEPAIEFIGIPNVRSYNNSCMCLQLPSSRREAFALKNLIKFNDSKIPFLSENLANNSIHPLFDNQRTSEIHCTIVSEKIELTINANKVKPSELLTKAVNNALNGDFPFNNLKNVFDKFGHLWPQKIILGWIISKTCSATSINDEIIDDKFSLNLKDKYVMSEKIMEKLHEWSKLIKNLDTSFFLKSNGEVLKNYDIYENIFCDHFELDFNKSHEKYSKLQIVKREDLVPLYKILPKHVQNDIEEVVSNRYHIVMTGIVKIKQENQTHVNIRFVQPIQDNDYEIFGNLTTSNELRITDVMIRFTFKTQYGCRAIIHKPGYRRLFVGTNIFWVVLAKGHGYFSRHTRNIKIIHGKEILSAQLPFKHNISMSNVFSGSFIIATSFDSEDFTEKQVIRGNVDTRDHSTTNLKLNISQYNMEEEQCNKLNDVVMRWCLIDTNSINSVNTDTEAEPFRWDSFGEVVSSKTTKSRLVNSACKWLENAIFNKDINGIEYGEFNEFTKIFDGPSSLIYKAEWASRGLTVALKTIKDANLEDDQIEELVKEVWLMFDQFIPFYFTPNTNFKVLY
ncbi:kinase-like protein [Gigaspora margarita]|uniref:Kinase-like protein n=1 Tax=Gigaspora margarita TaxID=4874 RepID=A0A8H3X880_GIGMA|nr:kinase-like protein [Gigaspora margarita]